MSEIDKIFEKLSGIEKMLRELSEKIDDMETDVPIGDWISEKQAKKITGLSRSSLYRLRKTNQITSSSLQEKKPLYRITDLLRLINVNETKK